MMCILFGRFVPQIYNDFFDFPNNALFIYDYLFVNDNSFLKIISTKRIVQKKKLHFPQK